MKMTCHACLVAAFLVALPSFLQAQPVKGQVQLKGLDKNSKAVEFFIGDELVTRYYTAGYAKPIFWPVNAPGNVPLTRNYPPPQGQATDHPHQKSAWFTHGDVIPEGIPLKSKIKNVAGVDFWSEAKGHGDIVCTSIQALGKSGNGIVTQNEWRTAEGQKIMDETRTVRLFDFGRARLIVVDIDMKASVCPITFGDTKEGSFGIRINDVINASKGKGKIQNAEGKVGEKACWGLISPWCDYSGPIDGKTVGIAILVDPKNAYPSCWHVRGYGLMAANPFGRDKHAQFPAVKGNNELVHLDKGKNLTLRYGMLLHSGDAISGQVAENYQRFLQLRDKE